MQTTHVSIHLDGDTVIGWQPIEPSDPTMLLTIDSPHQHHVINIDSQQTAEKLHTAITFILMHYDKESGKCEK